MNETPVSDSPDTSPEANDASADYWPEPMSPHRDDAAIRAEAAHVLQAWLDEHQPAGVTMTAEVAGHLRAPFPAEHIGKLPKITCRACSKAPGKVCNEHQKAECPTCGNYITKRHIDLDYVGHGAVTDRLLAVDPAWSWEPLAWEGEPWQSVPAFVYDDGHPVGLWIKLTVAGVTRLGMGTCDRGQSDAEKVLIGDALRNAAMRFGVALDLWVRGHADDAEQQTTGRQRAEPAAPPPDPYIDDRVRAELAAQVRALPEPVRDAIIEAWIDQGLPMHDGKPQLAGLRASQEAVARALIAGAVRAGAEAPPAEPEPPAESEHAPNGDEVRRAEIEAEVQSMTVAGVRVALGELDMDITGSGRDVRHRLVDARLAALQEAGSDG